VAADVAWHGRVIAFLADLWRSRFADNPLPSPVTTAVSMDSGLAGFARARNDRRAFGSTATASA